MLSAIRQTRKIGETKMPTDPWTEISLPSARNGLPPAEPLRNIRSIFSGPGTWTENVCSFSSIRRQYP